MWTASTPASSLGTSNVQADANIFVQGVNYVEFTNLTLVSTGVINIAWTGNTTATNYHNPQTEGIFNGLQLQTIALLPGVSIHPVPVTDPWQFDAIVGDGFWCDTFLISMAEGNQRGFH